jgi:hypothetical protein
MDGRTWLAASLASVDAVVANAVAHSTTSTMTASQDASFWAPYSAKTASANAAAYSTVLWQRPLADANFANASARLAASTAAMSRDAFKSSYAANKA